MKVVATIENSEAPAANIDTAINWALPAKTNTDISPISSGDSPAFWASTPKARPIGKYPKQMGHAAAMPREKGVFL